MSVNHLILASVAAKVNRKHTEAISGIAKILESKMDKGLKLQLILNVINDCQAEINGIISQKQ